MLPIAERELRVAARMPRTYRSRVAIASIGVFIFAWMMGLLWWGRSSMTGSELFQILTWIAFIYCLFSGAILTADSLSSEKREGTLGLLFLTDLKGYDIVLGKLVANSLNCFFGLLAMFPVLAIPLIMGGVQLTEFTRVLLSLSNTLLFSISLGLLVSTFSKHSIRATSLALLLLAFTGFGLSGLGELMRVHYHSPAWGRALDMVSPFYTHTQAFANASWRGSNSFWWSLLTTHAIALICLALACATLPRIWQEKPGGKKTSGWRERWHRWKFGAAETRSAFRTRLLDFNPVFWLGARERIGAISSLLLILGFAGLGLWVGWQVGPYFGGPQEPLGGFVFVWFWTTSFLHVILLFRIATLATHRFAEDRPSGALELLLSTPLSVGQILRGQWLALMRQMWGPMCAVALAHGLFIWGLIELFVVDRMMSGTSAAGVITAILKYGLGGQPGLDWHLVFVLIIVLCAGVLLAVHWMTLPWLGMWMGIKASRARNAPWATLALALIPPWPVFILFVMAMNYLSFFWTEFEMLYLCLGVGFGLSLVHNLILTIWARRRLRRDFRLAVTDRFEFLKSKWSWARRRRLLLRFALGAAALYALIAFWRFEENWRGHRAWIQFKRDLGAEGETLELKSLAPAPVPVEQNFIAAPIFPLLFDSQKSISLDGQPGMAWQNRDDSLGSWQRQKAADLKVWQKHFRNLAQFPRSPQTNEPSVDVLLALSKFDSELAQVREASRRPYSQFPVGHSQSPLAPNSHATVFRSLGEILQLRAIAYLVQGRTAEAIEDMRVIVRLADAVNSVPLTESQSGRSALLASAIQVAWEGLTAGRWSADQIAAIQGFVEPLNVLADYPKMMHNEMIQQIAAWDYWRSIITGEIQAQHDSLDRRIEWLSPFYPAGWTYYHQIKAFQLYRDVMLPVVDVAQGKVLLHKAEAVLAAVERSDALLNNVSDRYRLRSAGIEFAQLQIWLNQAALACALERYRLSHGKYPETLDSLVPEYLSKLPRSVITGAPIEYRRTDQGQFTLVCSAQGQQSGTEVMHRWVWYSSNSNGLSKASLRPGK